MKLLIGTPKTRAAAIAALAARHVKLMAAVRAGRAALAIVAPDGTIMQVIRKAAAA